MSKWEHLDDEYEQYQSWEPIRKDGSPVGGITEHVRYVDPNRNGAYKRVRQINRRMKEYGIG